MGSSWRLTLLAPCYWYSQARVEVGSNLHGTHADENQLLHDKNSDLLEGVENLKFDRQGTGSRKKQKEA